MLDTTLSKLKSMAETSTVIGEKMTLENGTVIIPISKVTMGYVAGGGEHKEDIYVKNKRNTAGFPFAGGSGAALNLTPVGFLVGENGDMRVIKLDNETPLDKFMDIATDFISKEVKNRAKKS